MKANQVKEAKDLGGDAELSPSPALSGRVLDAVLAERVMGFVRHRSGVLLANDARLSLWFDDEIYAEADKGQLWARVPRYSTDIAAAMQVVEKMRERFTNVSIHAANGWGVSFANIYLKAGDGEMVEQWTQTVHGDTLPEAICRAALQAVALGELARDAEITTVR